MRGLPLLIALTFALPGAAAAVQPNRCAQCHYVNFFDVPASVRLGEWGQSAHAKHDVGCERCHGGDPTTFVPPDAHRNVLASRDAASPVNRANLPFTCGACHPGPARAFGRSRHLVLLQQGDDRAPTCSTCHGAMTARRPSSAALEVTCASCHLADSASAVYPSEARSALNEVARVQGVLADAAMAMGRLAKPVERRRLGAEARLVESSLTAAIDALHAFDLPTVAVGLRTTQERAERLRREVKAAGR